MRALVFIAATASVAHARPRVIDGTVAATKATWNGDVIVTESQVRAADGTSTTVIQLGGSIDGIGMSFSHHPAVLHTGDAVSITGELGVTTTGAPTLVLASVMHRAVALAPAASATYGVQHTAFSNVAVWRDSGCIELAYDATTISPAEAEVLDASFDAWSTGTASCGRLAFTRTLRPDVPDTIDGITSVHIRRDAWCRPATATTPQLCYPADAAAVTRLVFVDNVDDPDNGKIVEADMELNAVTFELLLPGQTPHTTAKTDLYFQAVATHEAGHLIGLAHDCGTGAEAWPTDRDGLAVPSCDDGDAAVQAATMFYEVGPLDDGPSTLEHNDIAGACSIVSNLRCVADVEGVAGCNVASSGSAGWIVFVLVALGVHARSRRRSALMW